MIIGYHSPDLHKFCDAGFNVNRGCNTIRLGTLFSYRQEEDELLRDEGEGTFRCGVTFPKLTPVSPKWMEALQSGVNRAEIDELEIVDGHVLIKQATFHGSSINCWVFCMSASPEAAGNISIAHETSWSIAGRHIKKFGDHLLDLLRRQLTIADLPTRLQSCSISELGSDLSLDLEIQPITYGDRLKEIASEEGFPVLELEKFKAQIPFLKPSRFEDENEVRFAFFLKYQNERISVEDTPKILNLRRLDQFLDSTSDLG